MGATYGEIKERFEGLRRTPTVQRVQSLCRTFSAIERRLAEVTDLSAPASEEVVEAVAAMASLSAVAVDLPARVCDVMTKADMPGGTCGEGPDRAGDPLR